ncbi:MAG: FkbM family methyltransferase [Acidobacteriia bacterium]|nr:FkbM family methyltransferase [Terriglobia bacterium]
MPPSRSLARKLKHVALFCAGREVLYSPEVRCPFEILGNEGANFAVCPDRLASDSVVYSFGIGTDISFDLGLMRRFGVRVHAFDPTPRSLAWLKTQNLPPHFEVHEYGVAGHDGVVEFAPPDSPDHVSHTIVAGRGLRTVSAPVRRLATIMRDLGHTSIDLLKMDVEGAEYDVIRDLVSLPLPVGQLCIEFHHRWRQVGAGKTRQAVAALRSAGYRLFHVSDLGSEYSFLGR